MAMYYVTMQTLLVIVIDQECNWYVTPPPLSPVTVFIPWIMDLTGGSDL